MMRHAHRKAPPLGRRSEGLQGARKARHNRFGRGRGNGTGPRSIAVLCTGRGAGSDKTGARKDAIGSFDDDVRPGDFGMEPVISSFVGVCFPPLSIFSSANMPNTRITAATMLSRVRRPRASHGTAKRFRMGSHPSPRRARLAPARAQREGPSYNAAA